MGTNFPQSSLCADENHQYSVIQQLRQDNSSLRQELQTTKETQTKQAAAANGDVSADAKDAISITEHERM